MVTDDEAAANKQNEDDGASSPLASKAHSSKHS
jgi:hypothetical protein